jgi:hypothetical protein
MCYAKFIGTDMSSWHFDDFNNDQQQSFMNTQFGYRGKHKGSLKLLKQYLTSKRP